MDQALAPNTRKTYKATFNRFLEFLSERQIFQMEEVTLAHVLTFLESFAGLRAGSTLRSYAGALKFYLTNCGRADLFTCPGFVYFMRGMRRLAPIRQKRMEIWDPVGPLLLLKETPIVDARTNLSREEQFLEAGREALFLLLLASALRLDDVFKLGRDVYVVEQGLKLLFLEKRKCPISGEYTPFIVISAFPDTSRLCPVRALFCYLGISSEFRADDEPFLFVSRKGRRAAKPTLRRWVCDLLSRAGIQASAGSCRSAASSLAHFSKVPMHEILASAGWSSENTFRKFYCRPISNVPPVLFAAAMKKV